MDRRGFLMAGIGAALAGPALADPPAHAREARADAAFAKFLRKAEIADAGVAVMRGEETLYLRYAGAYGPTAWIPIASASKWMMGAAVMSLADDGLLALDAPVGQYVPGLPATHAALRLDQLMSYTAGLPGLGSAIELLQPPNITLTQSAVLAARQPLVDPPGAAFRYGGPNLQFVGAAAERVSGLTWHELFRRRISEPLGLANTYWGRVNTPPDPAALVRNPVLQGGVWTTLPDYAAFLTMIAQQGVYRGRRVLSAQAMAAMAQVMTLGIPKTGPTDLGDTAAEYMITHWCERLSGSTCELETSPGAFGVDPWVDRTTGLHGVLFVKDVRQRIVQEELTLRGSLIKIYA